MKNWKMRVTPEESRKVQEKVFEAGGKWSNGDRCVKHTRCIALFYSDGILSNSTSIEFYEGHSYTEITPAEFLNEPKYITAEWPGPFPEWWTGKPIKCRVWDGYKENAQELFVVGVTPGNKYPYRTADRTSDSFEDWDRLVTSWKHAEPILAETEPEEVTLTMAEVAKLAGVSVGKLRIKE